MVETKAFGPEKLDSPDGQAALKRALGALHLWHRRAVEFDAAGHRSCAMPGRRRHAHQPCTCCPACMLAAHGMLWARRGRSEHRARPWQEFLLAIAENPGQSAAQWVSEGLRMVATRVLDLPAKPRLVRDSARLVAVLRDHIEDEQAVVVARYIVGEAAHLGSRKVLDGDERPFNWEWIATSAVSEMQAHGDWDGTALEGRDARAIVLQLQAVQHLLPDKMRTTLQLLIFGQLAGDVSADALLTGGAVAQQLSDNRRVETATLPHRYDEIADIVAVRALRTVGPGVFLGLDADQRRHALHEALREALRVELTARGAYELGVLGPELVATVVELAATTVAHELAQAAAAGSATTATNAACLATLARLHHAAWGVQVSRRDEDLDALCADLRERIRSVA